MSASAAVAISTRPVGAVRGDLALPFFEGPRPGPGVEEAEAALGARLTAVLRARGFRGKPGELVELVAGDRAVLAVGVGTAPGDAGAIRDAAQRLAWRSAGTRPIATTLARVGADRAASVRAAAEGTLLGAWRYARPGTGAPAPRPRRVTLLLDAAGAEVRAALARGVATGETANWVRDMAQAPASEATPTALAEEIAAAAARHGATARIWSAAELEERGFGGVLGVGRGSRHEPRLVELGHLGADGPPVALTGKGITFDSGGLNLKRDPDEIAWMRSDMAGGAAAAAAIVAAARLGLRVHAVGVVPFAENMPGGGAMRPGDVLTHPNGRTSEVIDTDSEGRLVVADALAWLAERRPVAIVDVATLTDAGGIGPSLWAAMATDDALVAEVLAAGEAAGEPGWRMPLRDDYRGLLDTTAADIRNTPAHGADTAVMAAMFLRDFAGSTPWVHIDNGSSAWMEWETDRWPEGATGSPVRALLRFLEGRADAGSAP